MITVYKFRGRKTWLVGQYEGSTKNMQDVFRALELARQDCPTGKLVVGGVEVPDRKKKEPEIK